MKIVNEIQYCCNEPKNLVDNGDILVTSSQYWIRAVIPYRKRLGYAVVYYCPCCGTKINE